MRLSKQRSTRYFKGQQERTSARVDERAKPKKTYAEHVLRPAQVRLQFLNPGGFCWRPSFGRPCKKRLQLLMGRLRRVLESTQEIGSSSDEVGPCAEGRQRADQVSN